MHQRSTQPHTLHERIRVATTSITHKPVHPDPVGVDFAARGALHSKRKIEGIVLRVIGHEISYTIYEMVTLVDGHVHAYNVG